MEFYITRTSGEDPGIGSYQKEFVFVENRHPNRELNDLPDGVKQEWYGNGRNHRESIWDGSVVLLRDIDKVGWFIELNTPEDILKFADKHERIIIEREWFNEHIPHIEIYDDYRD